MKKMTLMILILSIFTGGCTKKEESEINRPIISGINIVNISMSQADEFYEISATVQSKTSSIVSSMIMGKVTSLNVQEGDKVTAGQLLLTIDNKDTAQKAIGAKAGINEALKASEAAYQNKILINKTFQRYKNLFKENVLTKQEFDQITAQKNIADIEYQRTLQSVNKAQAGLGEIGVYQSYSRVTAPVSGIVTEKNIDKGSTAIPGEPLLTIETPSNLELVANVNESMINKVKTGMPVYLETENKTIKSNIATIIPKIDPETRTFKIKIVVSGLKSGQYAKIKIPIAKKEAILVPTDAIVQKGQLTGVYTVDKNNIISYRLIRIGKTFGSETEILSGLDKEDKIITSGVEKATDGGEVRQ
jgi:RND family efflux transporter MFP subunit